MGQVNAHSWNKTCLCHPEKKTGRIELSGAVHQTGKNSCQSPGNHDSRGPFMQPDKGGRRTAAAARRFVAVFVRQHLELLGSWAWHELRALVLSHLQDCVRVYTRTPRIPTVLSARTEAIRLPRRDSP